MRNTFAKHLYLRALEDPSIILIAGDLGYGVLDEFSNELPKQYLNSGINEQAMVSMAAGLSSQGFKPFVYSIANFPTFRCLEQIRNDVCYMQNPVTIVSVGAGFGYGTHGYSHHAVEDLGAMRILPNMNIFSPADPLETSICLDRILKIGKPAYLRLGKGGEANLNDSALPNSSGLRVLQDGQDAVIAWTGGIGSRALNAGQILKKSGIDVALISVPILGTPAIQELLKLAGERPLITLEEHSLVGGFGSWVLEEINQAAMPIRVKRLGIGVNSEKLIGSQDFLLDSMELRPENIAQSVRDLIKRGD